MHSGGLEPENNVEETGTAPEMPAVSPVPDTILFPPRPVQAGALLLVVAAAACLGPAHRAASIAPMDAVRHE